MAGDIVERLCERVNNAACRNTADAALLFGAATEITQLRGEIKRLRREIKALRVIADGPD